jgi:hypothetical protein
VTRRAALPGAAELFRSTDPTASSPFSDVPADHVSVTDARSGSGRRRHDAKITVYVSDDELVELEQARLTVRAKHGIVVDRGRIVREAIAVVLADLAARGADSVLVRRLQGERNE